MSETVTRSRENTRARLLDAAFDVFVREGFAGASIETLTDEAGFTRGAFYSNYDSKDELFIDLVRREFQRRLDRAVKAFKDLDDQLFEANAVSAQGVGKLIASTFLDGAAERNWQILYTEFELFSLRNPDIDHAVLELNNMYITEVVRAITPLLESVGAKFVGDPTAVVRTVMTACMSVARGTFLDPELDFEGALARQMEWFTVMLDRLVEPN